MASASTSPATPRRRRWPGRMAIASAVAFVLYTLFGFFGVPLLIRHVGVPQLNARLTGRASLAEAACNPFTWSLRLAGFEVKDASGARVLAFDEFRANVEPIRTVFLDGWFIDHVRLSRPFVDAALSKEGRLSLAELWKPAASAASGAGGWEPRAIPRVIAREIVLSEASGQFADHRPGRVFEKAVSGLSVSLSGVDTRPDHDNPLTLTATTADGERLEWTGTVRADPLSSKGTLAVTDVALARLMPYIADVTEAEVTAGTLSLRAEYEVAPVRARQTAVVRVPTLSLRGFAATQPDGPLLTLDALELTDVRADAAGRSLGVAGVSITAPSLEVRRGADGVLSVTRVLVQADSGVAEPAESAAAPRQDPRSIEFPLSQLRVALTNLVQDALGPWALEVEAIEMRGARLRYLDLATTPEADLAFTEIDFDGGPVRSTEAFRTPFGVRASAFGGTARLAGVIEPVIARADFDAEVDAVGIAPFAPFLPIAPGPDVPPMVLAGGTLTAKGSGTLERDEAFRLKIGWTGPASIAVLGLDRADGAGRALAVGEIAAAGRAWAVLPPAGAPTAGFEGEAGLRGVEFQSEVRGPVTLALASLGVEGKAMLTDDAAEGATFAGTIRLEGLSGAAPSLGGLEVSVDRLEALGVDAAAGAPRAAVESLAVTSPTLRATVPMLPPIAAGDAVPGRPIIAPGPGESADLPDIRIGVLTVAGGTVEAVDPGADPPATAKIESLELRAAPVALDARTPSEVTFSCMVHQVGTVDVKGRLDPLAIERESDVTIGVRTLPLKPFDAFAGRFAGYRVESGRATLDLPLTIREGKLKGTLDFSLDNTHLGDKVDSPSAPDVPLKLGLDLLRDPNDRVAGSLPLSGDITDPEFSFGGLIWKAFLNLIGGIVTAPFKLLGGLVGLAEGQDLSRIEFPPGSAELSPDALIIADGLVKALDKRQSLSLGVVGRWSEADVPVVKVHALRERLAAARKGAKPDPEDPAYRDALEDAYRDAHGREAIVESRKAHPEPAALLAFYERALTEGEPAPDDRLAALAASRAKATLGAIEAAMGGPSDRVSIVDPEDPAKPAESPRADFTLAK